MKKIAVKKTKILKTCQKKSHLKWPKGLTKLEILVDRQEQYSRRNSLLLHGIAETNDENPDDPVFRKINEKLDVHIAKSEIDRSQRIGRK